MTTGYSRRSVVAGALASACVGRAAGAQDAKRIAIGDVAPIAPDWPSFIAKDKELFRREGLDPEITYVGNVANTVQQMIGGSFAIAVSTFDTAIRAIAKGADATMIGGLVVKYPYSIMSDAEVKTAADLKGRRIILPFQKDLLTAVWNRWVREQGVDPAAIEQVYDGATPNRFAALTAHRVQAALVSQPFDFRALSEGYRKLLDIGAYGKDFGFLVLLARPAWLKDNAETARAYLRALSAGVDWLYDATHREEAIAILARNTKLPQTFAEQTYDYYVQDLKPFSRKLAIPEGIVQATVKILVEIGDIKETDTSGKRFVDAGYLPQ
jgi:ABC-type nitrate/sulfonate/bicarbonate transport system substrate-binding protein